MNVSGIGSVNFNSSKLLKTNFGKNENKNGLQEGYENPISRKTERNLAILGAFGGSAVVGAIVGGLSTFIFKSGIKAPVITGVIAGVAALALTLPSKIYHTAINAFTREKEMDIFSRDRALKSNLTEEVHKEVMNPEVSLDKKLDDNLKLQTANRAAALLVHNNQ